MEIKTYILTIGTVPNNPTSDPMTTVTPNSLTSASSTLASSALASSTLATTSNPSNTTVPKSGNGLIVSINLFICSFTLYFYMLTNQ